MKFHESFKETKCLKDLFFTPLESPAIYGEDGEKNVHSLLRAEFKTPPFLTGFTYSFSFFSFLWECKKVYHNLPLM